MGRAEAAPKAEAVRRRDVISRLADAIASLERPHPLRVAVDGVGASGKTVLADELARELRSMGLHAIRAGIDGFHRPRAERHRRGPESPLGYYMDSFDYRAARSEILEPLGPGGDRRYRTAVYDFRTDRPVAVEAARAPDSAVLIFDGIFLLRPELSDVWDFSVYVDAGFDVTLKRALERDVSLFGSAEAVRKRYLTRYIPGEKMYLDEVRPREAADAVVMNDDPTDPELRLGGRSGDGRRGRWQEGR